jgi:hypothetical protein
MLGRRPFTSWLISSLVLVFAETGLAACTASSPSKPKMPVPDADRRVVSLAMDHALSSIDRGGPLVPFTILLPAKGKGALQRFVVGGPTTETFDIGASAAKARAAGRAYRGARAVAAFDGYVTENGERLDAIYVTLFQDGTEYSFDQRYIPGSGTARLRRVGDLEAIGPTSENDWSS